MIVHYLRLEHLNQQNNFVGIYLSIFCSHLCFIVQIKVSVSFFCLCNLIVSGFPIMVLDCLLLCIFNSFYTFDNWKWWIKPHPLTTDVYSNQWILLALTISTIMMDMTDNALKIQSFSSYKIIILVFYSLHICYC